LKTILVFAIALATSAVAGPECTKEPKSKWKNARDFEEQLKKEYKVKVFKVTKGNCY
jgi:hypothetical protein